MNEFATNNLLPSLTIILNVDPRIAMERIGKISLDRMESKGIDYFNKVNAGYLQISKLYSERCKIIDCNEKNIIDIHKEIIDLINKVLIKEK